MNEQTRMDETDEPRRRKLPSLTGLTVVEIMWVDATVAASQGGLEPEDLPVPTLRYTAGYLVADEEGFLQVTMSISGNAEYDYAVAIPKCAIHDERRRTL